MKILLVTSEDGPEMREAKDLGSALEQDGYVVEYMDAETAETHAAQELYDIYSYPTFVVVQDDGTIIEKWPGITPLASDIKMFLG